MRTVNISPPENIKHMENFNAQYGKHSQLELLKHFILEHGTYMELKKGEQFSVQGKMNRRGAYIENGLLRYTRVDERGNIHILGYTFSNEFTGSLCTFINPCLLYTSELGGEIIQVQSPHITDAIVQACKEKQISTLCIGRPALKYPSAILAMVHYRNMLEELAQLGIDLIILA